MRPIKDRPYSISDKSPSMTKQSFKDECNINKIMDKFQKSGAITHFASHAPTYGDATPVMLHDALMVVANANTMFEELPSSIRKKFENDPSKFLEFVQDPKNSDEMIKLGLKSSPLVKPEDQQRATEEHASASAENKENKDEGPKANPSP